MAPSHIGSFDQTALAPRRHALSPVHTAALANGKALRALLRNPLIVHLRDEDEATLLHLAAKRGLVNTVPILLKAGALVDARTRDGDTALSLAVTEGHDEIARQLLDAGASANATNARGENPLLLAARAGRTSLLRALVRAGGVIVTKEDIDAVKTEADKRLLRSAHNLFLFRWARTWKQPEAASAILAQSRTDEDFGAALHLDPAAQAVLSDSPDELAALVPRHASPQGDWTTENSLLEWAVLAKATKVISWLLANPQGSTTRERLAAVALALDLKQASAIELLVKHRVPVANVERLPFLSASLREQLVPLARDQEIYGNWESSSDYDLPGIAKKIEEGAPPPLPRDPSTSPDLRYLLMAGRPVPANTNLDQRDAAGCSLLHFAAAGGNESATRLLLEKSTVSPSDSQCTSSSLTPLALALHAGAPRVAEALLAKGAIPTSRALGLAIAAKVADVAVRIANLLPKQELAKHLESALRYDIPEIVEMALAARRVNLAQQPGCELAVGAARSGATGSLAVLLNHGALPDGACGSLLVAALEAGKHKTAEMLARRGASASASDWQPLRLALRHGARGVLRDLLFRNARVATRAHELEVDAAAGGFLEFVRRPKNASACLNAATQVMVATYLARLPGATTGATLKTAVRTGNPDLIRVLLVSGVRPTVDDVRAAFLQAFSRRGTNPRDPGPDKNAQKTALATIGHMLLSRNWSGGEIDSLLMSVSSPDLFPSSLFGDLLRTRQKLAPPPTAEALARIAVHATDGDLKLLVGAYPSVLASPEMWQAAVNSSDDKALLSVKARSAYDRNTLLEHLRVAIDHRLSRTASALVGRLGTLPGANAAESLVKAIRNGLPTVAHLLLPFPGALSHPQLLTAVIDPTRLWLVDLLVDLGAPDPAGLGMEALLNLADSRPAVRPAVMRLLARGLSTDAMVRNAGRLEFGYHVAEHFMATLAPLEEESDDSAEGKILLDLVSALVARRHALPILRDVVEGLGAPLERQEGGGYGTFPLRAAIQKGDVEVVRYLLAKHATVVSGCSEAIEALPTRELPGKKAIRALLDRFDVHPIGACGG